MLKPYKHTACMGLRPMASTCSAQLRCASHLAWDKHYGHSSKWACGPFVAWPKCFGIYQWIYFD